MSQQTESPTIILGESNLVRPVEQQSEPAKMVEQGNRHARRSQRAEAQQRNVEARKIAASEAAGAEGQKMVVGPGAHKTRAHTKKLTDADGVQAAEYQVIEDIVQATEAL